MDGKYIVNVQRDTQMMKTFIKFNNRIRHPRVSLHLFIIGAALLGMPIAAGGGKRTGIIFCVLAGSFLILMSVFRHHIAVAKMRKSPEIEVNEKLSYYFEEKEVAVVRGGRAHKIGKYKKIYQVWEDETTFFIGMNEEDLLILPKTNFETGDWSDFREFVLEKSGAAYSWIPWNPANIFRQKIGYIKEMERNQRENLKSKSRRS